MRKIYLRLLPLAVVSYLLAYIDRINVSFAGLRMRDDLNMPAAASGFALGTFYWGYSIFELPSNLITEKLGARLWIARIMRGEVHMPKETPPTDQGREIMTVRSVFLPGRTGNSRIERLRDRAKRRRAPCHSRILMPVMPKTSRSTHSSGVSPSTRRCGLRH
jgi:hypothetical protein